MGSSKWMFSSIKENKIEIMCKVNCCEPQNYDFINRVLCAKDFGRYNIEPDEANPKKMTFFSGTNQRKFSRNYLEALHSKNIFIHDEVHHWSHEDFFYFMRRVRPKRMVFTVVYPPELLQGYSRSQNPDFYTYEVLGDEFTFNPDGVTSECYHQRLNMNWLFKASHFNVDGLYYTCKMVKSMFAHHMFEVVPGEHFTDHTRTFSHFDTINLSVIEKRRFTVKSHYPIRLDFISKIYTYLKCLKKPDKQSGLAKLRQLMDQEQDLETALFFEPLIEAMIDTDNSVKMFGHSLMTKAKMWMTCNLPSFLAKLMPGWSACNFFNFLVSCKTLQVKVKTCVVSSSFVDRLSFDSVDTFDDIDDEFLNLISESGHFDTNWFTKKDNMVLMPNGSKFYRSSIDPFLLQTSYWRNFNEPTNSDIKEKFVVLVSRFRMQMHISFYLRIISNRVSTCCSNGEKGNKNRENETVKRLTYWDDNFVQNAKHKIISSVSFSHVFGLLRKGQHLFNGGQLFDNSKVLQICDISSDRVVKKDVVIRFVGKGSEILDPFFDETWVLKEKMEAIVNGEEFSCPAQLFEEYDSIFSMMLNDYEINSTSINEKYGTILDWIPKCIRNVLNGVEDVDGQILKLLLSLDIEGCSIIDFEKKAKFRKKTIVMSKRIDEAMMPIRGALRPCDKFISTWVDGDNFTKYAVNEIISITNVDEVEVDDNISLTNYELSDSNDLVNSLSPSTKSLTKTNDVVKEISSGDNGKLIKETIFNPKGDGNCFYSCWLEWRRSGRTEIECSEKIPKLRNSIAEVYLNESLESECNRVSISGEWAIEEDINILINLTGLAIPFAYLPDCVSDKINLLVKRPIGAEDEQEPQFKEGDVIFNLYENHFTLVRYNAKTNVGVKQIGVEYGDHSLFKEEKGVEGLNPVDYLNKEEAFPVDMIRVCPNVSNNDWIDIESLVNGFFSAQLPRASLLGTNTSDRVRSNKVRGREIIFLTKDPKIDYWHNDLVYHNNCLPGTFNVLINLLSIKKFEFNAVLIQKYDTNATVGFHSDDENCYDENCIVQVNLFGHANFSIKKRNDKGHGFSRFDGESININMGPRSMYRFKESFQRDYLHKVKSLSCGRVSLTFRKHVHRMDGSPLLNVNPTERHVKSDNGLAIDLDKNTCLVRSVSKLIGVTYDKLKTELITVNPSYWVSWFKVGCGATFIDCHMLSEDIGICLVIEEKVESNALGCIKLTKFGSGDEFKLSFNGNHFKPIIENNGNGDLLNSTLDHNKSLVVRGNLANRVNSEEKNKNPINSFVEQLPHSTVIAYKPSSERAAKLRKAFLDGTVGIKTSKLFDDGDKLLSFLDERAEDVSEGHVEANQSFDLSLISGFAGSGKSRSLQGLIQRGLVNVMVIVPRVSLCEDWKEKTRELNGPIFNRGNKSRKKRKRVKILTYEMALRVNTIGLDMVVVDEMTQFPNGYLDLLLMKIRSEHKVGLGKEPRVLILFCPLQSRDYQRAAKNVIDNVSCIDRVLNGKEIRYLSKSYRLSKKFFCGVLPIDCLGCDAVESDMPEHFDQPTRIYENMTNLRVKGLNTGFNDVILASSLEEVQMYSSISQCLTFGMSQGLTFNRACIVISEFSLLNDPKDWVVALTRSRFGVDFLVEIEGGLNKFMERTRGLMQHKIICSILGSRSPCSKIGSIGSWCKLSKEHMYNHINCKILDVSEKIGGSDEVDRELRTDGDLFLRTKIFLGQRICEANIETDEFELDEANPKTHICVNVSHGQFVHVSDLIREKELREHRIKDMVTDQFTDNYNKVGPLTKQIYPGPMRFEAIYPRHKTDDDATFWMAVHKRLKFSEPHVELRKTLDSQVHGRLLCNFLVEKLRLDNRWDQQLFEESRNDFEEKKLSKSCATISNNSSRSDVDWSENSVFLFIKNQLCTKFEKQYVDAKAGQTISCFAHSVLCKFAPWCRYMEKKFRGSLPDNYYIHSNKNFDQLNEWVKGREVPSECVESDYEAFDASQDHIVLAVELELMRFYGLPRDIISDYLELKTNLKCKLGNLSILRFSGEFGTFFFNTMVNILYTLLRYDVKPGTSIAFAGDDMCILGSPRETERYSKMLSVLSLKAKVNRVENPMFCGWLLSRHGIVKEPELIFNRFMVSLERGTFRDCIENYAIEASYAYNLSEKLFDVLKSEKQVEVHQEVIRIIITNLHLVKNKVREKFIERFDGCK
uniref:Nonstructural polyprotein n=1 Tax=Perth betaflexivirus 1 TaxID=2201306 RepID=A0A2U8JQE1_9VIRU|nr:nonstructural polyprotein [Perth betaflexivirus 1]